MAAAGMSVLALLQTDDGRIWTGDYTQGVTRFGRGRVDRALSGLTGGNRVHALFQDAAKTVWLGTEGGLASHRDGVLTWYGTNAGLAGGWITSIAQTLSGDLWVGGKGGLFRLQGARFERFVPPPGAEFSRVVSLYADPSDALWIGAADRGLLRLAGGRCHRFTGQSGPPSEVSVSGMVSDERGYLWLATLRHGILRASKRALEECAQGRPQGVEWLHLDRSDGLRSVECRSAMQPTVGRSRDGRLWFATLKGLAQVDPATVRVNRQPPPIRIEAVRADGRLIPWEESADRSGPRLRVPAGSKRIEVDYAGLSFTAPEKMRFHYRLRGLDENWVDAGASRSAAFVGLEPGTYTFEVQARNNDGVLSRANASARIAIAPSFWQTRTVRLLTVLLLAGAAAGAAWRAHRAGLVRIQDRLAQQEALADERARSAALTQYASDVITLLNSQGLAVYESPSSSRILGYPEGHLLGKDPVTFVHPDDQAGLRRSLQQVVNRTNPGIAVPFRFRHANGRWVHLESLGTNLLDHPRVRGILVTTRDISERRRAEEQLRLLSQAVEQSPALVMITDAHGDIQYVNPRFVEVTGYAAREVLGRNPRLLKSGLTPGAIYRDLWTTVQRGERWFGELHNRKKNGDHYWESAMISPIRDSTGHTTHFLGIKEDITQRKAAEEAKGRLETLLRQAQKMEALGTLAGGIAHDFNNILGAILGYTELARKDAQHAPQVLESLDEVARAGARARDLIRQILAFSRQGKPERKPIRLQPIVEECGKLLRATLPASLEIALEIVPDPSVVLADSSQIHQVLMNLCTNAAHAMGGAPGRLTIGLHAIQADAALAKDHPDLRPGRYMRLRVADTGCGMDEATLKRIYDPFFTTKGPGEGTGLGLAVVHGIVLDHQGAIVAQSAPGEGSTFDLFFPALNLAPADAERDRPEHSRGRGERVLFVDDEPGLCHVAQKTLDRLGYRPTVHRYPAQALAQFQADPDAFDLLITDLTMPGMNGIDLAAAVLKCRPHLPVILGSGFAGDWTPAMAREAGIREVVAKPFSTAELAGAVARALRAEPR
jgi:PAS domain S-box-containing protein